MKTPIQFLFSIACFLFIFPAAYSQNNIVELLQVSAANEDDGIRVTWATQSEFNSLDFTVERSVNFYDYDSIGFVQAAGTSNTLINYSFLDENPPQVTCIYYKLKIHYNDFTYNYSEACQVCNIIYIQKTNVLYPQPVADVSYLVIDGIDRNQPAQVIISDATGKIVFDETLENTYHSTSLIFYCQRKYFYKTGLYFLRVINYGKEVFQTDILVI